MICVACSVHLISTYYVRKGLWTLYLNYPQTNEVRKYDHMLVLICNMCTFCSVSENTITCLFLSVTRAHSAVYLSSDQSTFKPNKNTFYTLIYPFQRLNHVYSGQHWKDLKRKFRIHTFKMAENMCRTVVSIVTRINTVQTLKHVYCKLFFFLV